MTTTPIFDLATLQTAVISQLSADIDSVLTSANLPNPLHEASLYAMSGGGKRVRPLLVLASFLTLQKGDWGVVRRAMLAVEMIHGYSLVHDDLPCMDDDDLRRGKPTCHVVYGEAAALLAGDVLQTLAFEVLGGADFNLPITDPQTTLKLYQLLAPRARRMVSGQQLDLNGENQALPQDQLECIHQDKTGALIEASVLMGAVCAGANADTLASLERYAAAIGLAFQVQDDVLDVVSDTATLGKTAGADEKLQKSTYVKLLGVDGASRYADTLFDVARQSVAGFGERNLLLQVVDYLQQRKS
jgi:farnesyl diphosphate synthase